MITAEKRKAIFFLHEQGMEIKEISRKLKVSRNTVREIIRDKGSFEIVARKTQIILDPDLLKQVYADCDGWIQRIYEKLTEEHAISIAYSTLTRKLREMEISLPPDQRSGQVPDQLGLEMQNDTSDYRIKLGDTPTKVIASMLYYRYSKVRYLKFYRSFNRFQMKCFFFEALHYFKHIAPQCVIDNTHLAVLHGTGINAVFVPEMISFAAQFGFKWLAHEKGHSNRKAGNERSFWTVETNFFPGRKFQSLEDLNQQALEWATQTLAHRPLSKTKLVPSELFESEKSFLKKLPPYVQPPFLDHERDTDQYGYIAFGANYYWIPGTSLEKVKVIQYSDSIKIYRHRNLLAEYLLPAHGVKNKKYPEGPSAPPFQPKHRERPTEEEEKRLRKMSPFIAEYLDYALTKVTAPQAKHVLLRKLDQLSKNLSSQFFAQTIQRAQHYGVVDPHALERIAKQLVRSDVNQLDLLDYDEEELLKRQSYQEGRTTDEPDLSLYDELMNPNDDDDQDE